MYIFSRFDSHFQWFSPFFAFIGSGIFLLLNLFLFYCFRRKDIYVALQIFFSCAILIFACFSPYFAEKDIIILILLSVCGSAVGYILFAAVTALSAHFRLHTEKRQKKERDEIFALPDKENTFLRDKLRFSLGGETEKEAKNAPSFFVQNERLKENDGGRYAITEDKVRLYHARDMLMRLKNAPLSAADRLETESCSRLLTVYAGRDALSSAEIRSLNDCLAAILKLTAKYGL